MKQLRALLQNLQRSVWHLGTNEDGQKWAISDVPFKTIEWIFQTGQMLQQLSIRVIHVLAKYT